MDVELRRLIDDLGRTLHHPGAILKSRGVQFKYPSFADDTFPRPGNEPSARQGCPRTRLLRQGQMMSKVRLENGIGREPSNPTHIWKRAWTIGTLPSNCLMIAIISCIILTGCNTTTIPEQNKNSASPSANNPQPSPRLKPEEVVFIQVNSLVQEGKSGIATVYRFASPRVREAEKTLESFTTVLESSTYRPLLEARKADYFDIEVDGDVATQVVSLTAADGTVSFFLFELSLQKEGNHIGCWMTESVYGAAWQLKSI